MCFVTLKNDIVSTYCSTPPVGPVFRIYRWCWISPVGTYTLGIYSVLPVQSSEVAFDRYCVEQLKDRDDKTSKPTCTCISGVNCEFHHKVSIMHMHHLRNAHNSNLG